ncbi:hypothetical protein LBW59_11795 [Ralstonia solanacearum]|uniref:Mor transcription activator domain-containing protein n=1 Tax=Ralstonia solanacearum TaxID=305 RepID=A0AAW5ZP62_RALSL|nr:Mor transcription activator family protein [Ralstonia solanacearum]MDB0571452.1 hypothetical protein [Ralstonia solanacearum]
MKQPTIPAFAQELMDFIGHEEAMALIREFGGVTLWIPKGIRTSGATYERLVEVVGQDAADKLVARYGGDRLSIPRCFRLLAQERWRRVIADYNSGMSAAMIARRHGITERAVWGILKRPV